VRLPWQRARSERGLLGVFEHHDALVECIEAALESGIEVRDAYTPTPSHEVQRLMKPGKSPVRFLTFAGGISGLAGGLALALWSSGVWDLVVAGKPVMHVIPFMVVGFELTILFGAGATFLGLLVFSRLPWVWFPARAYREEFSNDRFGLWLATTRGNEDEARSLLERHGALSVEELGGGGG